MAEIFWHNLNINQIVRILGTDIKKGLAEKEAKARIKIKKLLEEAGRRFFNDGDLKANIKVRV